ncbi:PIN domain-like protein [Lentinula aff. detonsa]|nr:PIN domain-like protein [Lentinula aff. detonsa]
MSPANLDLSVNSTATPPLIYPTSIVKAIVKSLTILNNFLTSMQQQTKQRPQQHNETTQLNRLQIMLQQAPPDSNLEAKKENMGIDGLWALMHNTAITQKLGDFNVEHRFVKNVLLDTFHAANRGVQQRKRLLHASDTTLTQFYQFLCQLSEAGVLCLFCFNGPECPAIKRGRQVINQEPDYYKHARTLIKLFGYFALNAKGDADAELAALNRTGAIDAVLTKDSDVFPFGAQCILRVPLGIPKKELIIDVYHANTIQERTSISRSGFILIALLLQSDIRKGVSGIGSKTAYGLAQSLPQLSAAFQKLNNDMAHEIEFNAHGKIGSCSSARAQKFRNSDFPSLNDLDTLAAFITPPISSIVPKYTPRLPNVQGIAMFCQKQFGWQHFRQPP